jgi:hypothetical protein
MSAHEHPDRHPVYIEGTRRLLLRRFPFGLVYEVYEGKALILAIAHHRRRPGYWTER